MITGEGGRRWRKSIENQSGWWKKNTALSYDSIYFLQKSFHFFLLELGSEKQNEMFISDPYWLQFPKVHPWCNLSAALR